MCGCFESISMMSKAKRCAAVFVANEIHTHTFIARFSVNDREVVQG